MRARHKKASGGGVAPKDVYAGKDSNVVKESEERKRGGKVGMKMEGGKAKHRLDRPGRKRGGRVGADMAPLSSAAKTTKLSEEASGGG